MLGLSAVLVIGGSVGFAGVAAVATVDSLSEDLPDPKTLESLTFSQPTVVLDRTGKIVLGRFQREQRAVVAYDKIPKLVLDATITAEDRSFWVNDGYDPAAIVQAIGENVSGEGERGASTITQQLVRARLLPEEYVKPGSDRYLRKAKELIQAARLTSAFPGEDGKAQIITAYLNEIFYGHDAYGIRAAARVYFGVANLNDLTPAQAALLAALPKSPSTYDPYEYAEKDKDGRLVVAPDAPVVVRRDYILRNLATSRWTELTPDELKKALAEPVVLSGVKPLRLRAPHFTWRVRRQLVEILGSSDAVDTGGYRVITSLDWNAQKLAEKWVSAAVIAPNLPSEDAEKLLDQAEIPDGDRTWINALRGKDLHNAALVAIDYKAGHVMAYVGSGGYYREDLASPEFEPKYDAAGDGARQPGSAFKPIVYATGFEQRKLTPGSLLLDVTTLMDPNSDPPWVPKDADQLDRGPVLARRALQYSLNVPALRAIQRIGNEAVADQADKLGVQFLGGRTAFLQAGLSGAIGTVEVRPLDLTAAYGALANGGQYLPPQMILEIRDASGKVVYKAPEATPRQAISPESAYLVTDILAGNTDPKQNPIWAKVTSIENGPNGRRRPAAVKTGTANDAKDLATYGYLPPPRMEGAPGLAVGIWMGNSDNSPPVVRKPDKPATSLTAAAPLWRAYVRELSREWPVVGFQRPETIVRAEIDKWSGGQPGQWTHERTREYFAKGTEPGSPDAVDTPGLLYSVSCGLWQVDPLKAEFGPSEWDADVEDWVRRARQGVGVQGRHETKTAYFWGESSWGGQLVGDCRRFRFGSSPGNAGGTGTTGAGTQPAVGTDPTPVVVADAGRPGNGNGRGKPPKPPRGAP
jgi:peptidoglycan glycosyltransferase